MPDVIFIFVIIAFFALMTLFVHVCDKIIGADENVVQSSRAAQPPREQELAA